MTSKTNPQSSSSIEEMLRLTALLHGRQIASPYSISLLRRFKRHRLLQGRRTSFSPTDPALYFDQGACQSTSTGRAASELVVLCLPVISYLAAVCTRTSHLRSVETSIPLITVSDLALRCFSLELVFRSSSKKQGLIFQSPLLHWWASSEVQDHRSVYFSTAIRRYDFLVTAQARAHLSVNNVKVRGSSDVAVMHVFSGVAWSPRWLSW